MGNKMENKKRLIITAFIILFVLNIIFTITGNEFFVELTAPFALFMAFLLFTVSLGNLGVHRFSASFIGLAILCLVVCDIVRFLNHFILGGEPYSNLLRFVYVLPSLLYALNETIYFWNKLKKRPRDYSFILVNTFTISVISFVIQYSFYVKVAGKVTSLLEFSYLLFIMIASYTVMMCIQTFYLLEWKDMFKATNLITIGILVYEVLDIQYVFKQAAGYEPDSYLGDLAYMLCVFLMALGTSIQVEKKYTFELKKIKFDSQSIKIRLAVAVSGIVASFILMVLGVIGSEENANIIIAILSFTVMNYLLYTEAMNEQQSILLEKKVREKTMELQKSNNLLMIVSSTDLLTGLYNRRYGREILENLVEDEDCKVFVLYNIDLNLFKPINDTYGHEMGDRVLEEFGRRMNELPPEFISIRTGGDEFLIVQKLEDEDADLKQTAEMLCEIFRTPVQYETYCFNLSASIGIAVYPQDSKDISELMTYCDTAMYDVKSSGHKDGYRFFNSNLVQSVSIKDTIRKTLEAMEPERDFVLYFQPQVDASTKEIVGVEAFPHLKGDMEKVSPGKIIPVAEETGVMSKLGIWIVRDALTRVDKWNKEYGKNISLTVNLSPLQLIDADYSKALTDIVNELEINPSMLILDVANDVVMGAANSAKDSMRNLKERGFVLSLNDFGGEDINLSYVYDCGFDGLKLSRSLVAAKGEDARAKTLVRTIMSIAREMGITVTAVGIEEEEQAQAMYELGVTSLQGYKYGRPERAEEIEKKLKNE